MSRVKDITSKRFGRLVVVRQAFTGLTEAEWYCECDCGNSTIVRGNVLRTGRTISCGCYRKEFGAEVGSIETHGMCFTRTYCSWRAMIKRCENEKHISFPNYGGRGIMICDRWRRSFEDFLADMGERPEEMTLDRIDVNGNYEPGNCRWADDETQRSNKRPPG